MKRSNYTSKESANNMLNANGYEQRLHFEDDQIEVALYENLYGTFILTRNTKNYPNKECDTLTQVMDDRKEGIERFSYMVHNHIFKLQ